MSLRNVAGVAGCFMREGSTGYGLCVRVAGIGTKCLNYQKKEEQDV